MKAVIKLDVPDWQIDSPVTIYFKDTMVKRTVCEKEICCKDCVHYHNDHEEYKQTGVGFCHKHWMYTSDDWYCADRESKNG